MSRFLEKNLFSLAKDTDNLTQTNYPFKNIYGSIENGRIFVNMEAVDSLASQMKINRDIALIIDLSGSMRRYYKDQSVHGFIQEIVETLLPFDSDGIDLYFYAARLVYSATIRSIPEVMIHVDKAVKSNGAFGTTMPIEAFEDFAEQLKKKQKNGTVLFLTDGGMDDRGVKLRRFYQNVLHTEFKTRDHFYCYAIEFGKGASGALKVLDGLYQPEQGPEDLFDIYKTHSLQKLSDILSQVISMCSVASHMKVHYTTEQVDGIVMINQNLLSSKVMQTTTSIYKIMSLGFDTDSPFTIHANVSGYSPMALLVKPSSEKVDIELRSKEPTPSVGVSLRKGEKVSLTKINPMLNALYVGLGCDVLESSQSIDLDAQVFMLNDQGKVPDEGYFVFYNQKTSYDGACIHSGDNVNGIGDDDDECIDVHLSKVSPQIEKILFTVTIHEAKRKKQTFGQVKNAYIRILDKNVNKELIRFELGEDYPVETSLVVGELYKHNGEWKFNAVGAGYQDELSDFCIRYGVELA
jgi:tellurium resistance protein TerD